MKNLIGSIGFVFSGKGIMLFMVLIFPYKTIASGESQKNHQESLPNWLSPLDPSLFENNLINNGTDEIFVNGFEFVPMICSDPLINPAGLQRDSYREIFISDAGIDLLGGATPTISDNNWPAFNDVFRMSVLTNKYLALEFNTDPVVTTSLGRFFFKAAPIPYGEPASGITYSISECPGDFRQSLGKCLHSVSSTGNFFWSTSGEFTDEQVCNLDLDKNYYFNFINSINEYDFDVSSCGSSVCGIMFINEN